MVTNSEYMRDECEERQAYDLFYGATIRGFVADFRFSGEQGRKLLFYSDSVPVDVWGWVNGGTK